MISTVSIRVDRIEPNNWNPNKQSEFVFEREKRSIETFDFIDPCTVRKHPTKRGRYQIVDGEHRWRAAVELGMSEIDCVNLGVISDARAMALTDILNNLRGKQNQQARARLLTDVLKEDASLREVLPYSDHELDSILSNLERDQAALSSINKTNRDGTIADGQSGWIGLKVSLTPEQHAVIGKALGIVKKQIKSSSDAECLTALCMSFSG